MSIKRPNENVLLIEVAMTEDKGGSPSTAGIKGH